jgi:hypothetical protein
MKFFEKLGPKKRSFYLGTAFVLLLFQTITSIPSKADGIVQGILSTGSKPSISTRLTIHEGGTTNIINALEPQKDFDIKVTVTDNDGIYNTVGGIKQLDIKMWYDQDGDDLNGEIMNTADQGTYVSKTSHNPQDYVKISWDRASGAILSGGGSTWELDLSKSIFPDTANETDPTFTFVFNLKIGKIAKEASNVHKWQIAAKVSDMDDHSDYRAFIKGTSLGLPMLFYGEVNVATNIVEWNRIDKGGEFNAHPKEVTGISYIANGYYDELIKADSAWANIVDPNQTVPRTSDATTPNSFALKTNTIDDAATSTVIPVNESNHKLRSNQPASNIETPVPTSNFLFIKLNETFHDSILYTGNITYGISNYIP